MGFGAGVAWSLAGACAHSASDALRKVLSARGFGASDVVAGVAVLDALVAPALALALELAAPPAPQHAAAKAAAAAAGAGGAVAGAAGIAGTAGTATAAAAGGAAAAAAALPTPTTPTPTPNPPSSYAPASYVLVALASSALMLASKLLYQSALGAAPLSLTVPYLAFTPAMVVATAFFFLNEIPPPAGLAGVAVVALGGFWLGMLGAAAGATEVGFAPLGAEVIGDRARAAATARPGLAKRSSSAGALMAAGGGGGGGATTADAQLLSSGSPPAPPAPAAPAPLLPLSTTASTAGGGGAPPDESTTRSSGGSRRQRRPSAGGGAKATAAAARARLSGAKSAARRPLWLRLLPPCLRTPAAMMLAVAAVWSVTATLDKAGVVRAPSVAAYFLAQRLAGGLGCALLLWRTARLAPLAGRVVAGAGGGGGLEDGNGAAENNGGFSGSGGDSDDDDGDAAAGPAPPLPAWAKALPWWAPPDLTLMLGVCVVEQAAVAFFLFAVAHLLVAYVIALKRLQLLLSVAAGALVFGERVGRRLPAIALMTAGMALIVLHPGSP